MKIAFVVMGVLFAVFMVLFFCAMKLLSLCSDLHCQSTEYIKSFSEWERLKDLAGKNSPDIKD